MSAPDPKRTRVCPLLLRCTALTCYTRHSPWAGSSRCSGASSLACSAAPPPRLLHWPHEKTDWEKNMRAIGLVLLSIAIMALLLTDADAKRRSSAQGSQAAGASRSWCATYGRKGTATTAVMPRNNSVWPRCGGSVAFVDLTRFQGRRMEPATPGRQVRHARLSPSLARPPLACSGGSARAALIGIFQQRRLGALNGPLA